MVNLSSENIHASEAECPKDRPIIQLTNRPIMLMMLMKVMFEINIDSPGRTQQQQSQHSGVAMFSKSGAMPVSSVSKSRQARVWNGEACHCCSNFSLTACVCPQPFSVYGNACLGVEHTTRMTRL